MQNATIKSRKINKKKVMRTLFIISFTIVPILSFLIFYIYVNFSSFVMAFQLPDDGTLQFVGLENFKWIFQKIRNGSMDETDNLRIAFLNTFKTFGIQMILLPIGLFNSYFIYKKIWGYKIFRIIFYIPSLVSSVVVCFFFTELMSSSGFMPKLLQNLYNLEYVPAPLVDSRFANKMVFLNLIWLGFPGNLIIWGGTFSRIPDSIIESAKLDG